MAVVSKDIAPEPKPRRLAVNVADLMLGLVGVTIGAVMWIFGARYTVDGALSIVNLVFGHLTIPAQFVVPPPWPLYLILAPLPVACSFIEWKRAPWDQERDLGSIALLAQALVWGMVFAVDALTTWRGIGVRSAATPTIMQQVAVSDWLRGALTAFLTVVPEWLMRSMLHVLKRSIRWRRG